MSFGAIFLREWFLTFRWNLILQGQVVLDSFPLIRPEPLPQQRSLKFQKTWFMSRTALRILRLSGIHSLYPISIRVTDCYCIIYRSSSWSRLKLVEHIYQAFILGINEVYKILLPVINAVRTFIDKNSRNYWLRVHQHEIWRWRHQVRAILRTHPGT